MLFCLPIIIIYVDCTIAGEYRITYFRHLKIQYLYFCPWEKRQYPKYLKKKQTTTLIIWSETRKFPVRYAPQQRNSLRGACNTPISKKNRFPNWSYLDLNPGSLKLTLTAEVVKNIDYGQVLAYFDYIKLYTARTFCQDIT